MANRSSKKPEEKKNIYRPSTPTYHRTTNQRIITQQRNHNVSSLLPVGLGVLYTWEWKFIYDPTDSQNLETGNWVTFIYAGITAQVSPRKRLTEHLSGPGDIKETGKKNKMLYIALNNARYNTYPDGALGKRTLSEEQLKTNVFKVVDVVSLFDLGLAESGMISNYGLNNTSTESGVDIQNLYNGAKKSTNNIIGLNQERGEATGGEGEPVKQSRAALEWLYAAFYAVTESVNSKPHIQTGRSKKGIDRYMTGSNVNDKMYKLLSYYINSEPVVKQSFVSSGVETESDIKIAVKLFLQYLGADQTKEGFELLADDTVNISARFNKESPSGDEVNTFIVGEGIGKKGDLSKNENRYGALGEIFNQIEKNKGRIDFSIIKTDFNDDLTESEIAEIKSIASKAKAIPEKISQEWISDEVFKATGERIKFSSNMSKFKGTDQDTLRKIYLFLLKVTKKRQKAGMGVIPSGVIGQKLDRLSEALGLGRYTKKGS